jgi:subtilase family serine protease
MRNRSRLAAITAGTIVVFASTAAFEQEDGAVLYGPLKVIPGVGEIARPSSSTHTAGRFHTHLQILVPERGVRVPPRPGASVPEANNWGQTPASLACVYNLVAPSNGCDPYLVSTVASGGSATNPIVIVDAYNNPTIKNDLIAFSNYFNLPSPNLTVYYCNRSSCGVTTPPRTNAGWALEEALDVQIAHSIAPSAPIILVEANSDSFTDLFNAERYAATLAAAKGGGVVSNSWGSDEFPQQTSYDSIFNQSGVVFFASAGDSPGVEYPSSSPYVVPVGGTTIVLDSSYQFRYQATWATNRSEAGGGGISAYESVPFYQTNLANQLQFGGRAVPDISADANPLSGLWVYCSPSTCRLGSSPWIQVGGTSLSSPLMAAMTNSAINNSGPSKYPSSTILLGQIYSSLGSTNYYQIRMMDPENTRAYCYNSPGDAAVTALTSGWNVCVGAGTPQGLGGF